MNAIVRQVSQVFRSLFRKPAFAIAVIVILALGIGINVATLGLLYRYYVAPLPYPQGSRIMKVYYAGNQAFLAVPQFMSIPAWLGLRKDVPALSASGIYVKQGYNVLRGSQELHLHGTEASGSVFTTLGVKPLLGRVFGPESTESGAQPVVVLSYRLWRTLFDGKPSAIGSTVILNGKLRTVIGIMPDGFNFPNSGTALWTPMVLTAADKNPDLLMALGVHMIGRLAAGATPASLELQANSSLKRQIAEAGAGSAVATLFKKSGAHLEVQSWRATQISGLHRSLILVLCATLLLMLLVWFNLANLFLTRSLARRGELALRQVLGAGRGQLMLSIAAENLSLSILGAIGGIVLGRFLIDAFSRSTMAISASAVGVVSWPTLIAIAAVLACISTVVFTAMELGALRANDLASTLRDAGARVTAGRNTKRVRTGLIAGQIALACTIVGTGLLLGRGLLNLNAVRLGFNPNHVVTFEINLPSSQYPATRMGSALNELRTAVQRLPGIKSVTLASAIPFDGGIGGNAVFPRPWNPGAYTKEPNVFPTLTDASYLSALGLRLIAGRNFLPSDADSRTSVALIDTLAANQLFGTRNVVGREFSFNGPHSGPSDNQPGVLFRIIGVVNTVRRANLGSAPAMGNVYTSFNQIIALTPTHFAGGNWYFAVRTPLSTTTVIAEIRNIARRIIPGVPLYDIQTMDQRVAASLASNRLLTVLVLLFAIGALVLAAVGLYALQAYSVAQRSREFGIRAALGATRNRLIAQVLGETARLLVIGLVVGLAGLAAIGVAFASAFYGIGAVDPAGMVIVVIVLAFAALAASWIPAWRASRVPPMVALRDR